MNHHEISAIVDALLEEGYWAEYAPYPVKDWQREVAEGDTREGYHDWIRNRLADEEEVDNDT